MGRHYMSSPEQFTRSRYMSPGRKNYGYSLYVALTGAVGHAASSPATLRAVEAIRRDMIRAGVKLPTVRRNV